VRASGPDLVYWINAATFLFSALLIIRIPAGLLQSEQGITRGHWRDLREGVAAFARSRPLLTALLSLGFAVVATGLVNVAEVFLATGSLHAHAFGYGLLWGGSGVGLVLGSLLVGPLVEHRRVSAVYPFAFVPWALGAFGAAIAPSIWFATLAMTVCGVGNGLAFPLTVLLVQQSTLDRIRGRVFTVIISVHNALLGVALAISGAVTGAFGPRWVYGVSAALLLAGGVTALALTAGRSEPALAGGQPA
jgi:MFS family permease